MAKINAEKYIGQTSIAKNGMKMTIVAYRGTTDIDVEFEDGTVVKHKTYRNFIDGRIGKPKDRVGETSIANNGQKMTIIKYNRANDIDIQFEDNTVVEHKSYSAFKAGQIKNPNCCNCLLKNDRVGETNINKKGQKMTITVYRNADDIDIQLEDGTVAKHKNYRQFTQGFDGMSKSEDLTGQRFGKLLVLERTDDHISPNGQSRKYWKCQCDCGNVKKIATYSLTKGLSKSCGCLRLTNHRCAIEGINDLASQRPDLLKEWDYDKNTIKPNKIGYCSNKKVWWKCSKCGHSWNATVNHRSSKNGRNCPKCSKYKRTSFPEQAIFYYVKQVFPDAINSDKHLGVEFDIYIPSLDVAIEYDGKRWHTKEKLKSDLRKNQLCIDNNIELIRVRESECVFIENCTVFKREDNHSNLSLDIVISDVLRYLTSSITVDVDTTRDAPTILSQYITKQYENSLSYCFPELAKEWHPTKNGDLTPDNFTKGSNAKVWWLGKCGHEYQMSIYGKTEKKYSQYCPICFKKKTYPPIICIETNEIFENASSALKLTNLPRTDYIYLCCRGKRETAGGYHWKFAVNQ